MGARCHAHHALSSLMPAAAALSDTRIKGVGSYPGQEPTTFLTSAIVEGIRIILQEQKVLGAAGGSPFFDGRRDRLQKDAVRTIGAG